MSFTRIDSQTADDSETILAQMMLPEDTNPAGNVHGGTLMKLADTAGGTVAVRHSRSRVVTVVVDSMTFEQPVYVGDLVEVRGRLTWTGRTSMEVEVTIEAEKPLTRERRHVSRAYLVYVALDESGHPCPVRPLDVATADGQRRWEQAEARRGRRLAEARRKGGS